MCYPVLWGFRCGVNLPPSLASPLPPLLTPGTGVVSGKCPRPYFSVLQKFEPIIENGTAV